MAVDRRGVKGRRCFGLAAVVLAVAGLSPVARARTITCHYTEPFIETRYDTVTRILAMNRADAEHGAAPSAKMAVLAFTRTRLVIRSKRLGITQEMVLDHHGSDGASDRIYPFSARWTEPGRPVIYGGCG